MSDSRKANDKLPRGRFYYIQVGHRFYAGEELDREEVKAETDAKLPYYNREQYRWGWGFRWGPRRNAERLKRDVRKGTTATYLKPPPKQEPKMVSKLTGRQAPILVDDLNDAKKYRKKEQAQNACKSLEAVYGVLNIKVSVKEGADK